MGLGYGPTGTVPSRTPSSPCVGGTSFATGTSSRTSVGTSPHPTITEAGGDTIGRAVADPPPPVSSRWDVGEDDERGGGSDPDESGLSRGSRSGRHTPSLFRWSRDFYSPRGKGLRSFHCGTPLVQFRPVLASTSGGSGSWDRGSKGCAPICTGIEGRRGVDGREVPRPVTCFPMTVQHPLEVTPSLPAVQPRL